MSEEQRKSSGNTSLFLVLAVLAMILAVIGFVGWFIYNKFYPRETYDPVLLAELEEKKLPDLPKSKEKTTDWPQWRGPYRDGISRENNIRTDWPEDWKEFKLWEQPIGEGYSTVVVADNRAYTMDHKDGKENVYCWDAETGKELWKFSYPVELEGTAKFDSGKFGPGPRSTPLVEGKYIYTVGATGVMHCLKTHPKNPQGEIVWKRNLLEKFGAKNLQWGVSFSPLIVGDLIYTNPGGNDGNSIVAFNKSTGKVAWNNLNDPAGYSSPIHAKLAGTEQIIFFTGNAVLGVKPKDGELLWRYPWKTSYQVNAATPIAVDDYVFISSGYGSGCAVLKIRKTGSTFKADPPVYKSLKLQNHFASSVYYKGHIYGFKNDILVCFGFQSRKVKWSERGFGKGSLLIAGAHLIVLGDAGRLAIAKADPEGFKIESQVKIETDLSWTVPVMANKLLYYRDQEKVICLDLRKK